MLLCVNAHMFSSCLQTSVGHGTQLKRISFETCLIVTICSGVPVLARHGASWQIKFTPGFSVSFGGLLYSDGTSDV